MSQNKRKKNNRGNMVIPNSENNGVDCKDEEMKKKNVGSSENNLSSSNRSLNNPSSPSSIVSSKISQRDLLIDDLNSGKVDCAVCYEKITNNEQIWSCMNCYQIFHLKCVMRWFCKSFYHGNKWKCPACQCEISGKPAYSCFCKTLTNPFSNNVNTPHSCGQVCNQQKKNSKSSFYCKHKCTLLCHPGPCPQCDEIVSRKCECGKTQFNILCSSLTPILCQNICSKLLSCNFHFCEKRCHAGSCESCKFNCSKEIGSNLNQSRVSVVQDSPLVERNWIPQNRNRLPDGVTVEELRMLEIEPLEFIDTNHERSYVSPFFEFDPSDNSGDEDISILSGNYRHNLILSRLNSILEQHPHDSIDSSSTSNESYDYNESSNYSSPTSNSSTSSYDY